MIDYNIVHDQTFWSMCWHIANRSSPIIFNKSNEKKWQRYWNSISNTYNERAKFDQQLALTTIDMLYKEGIIHKDFTVLDIGCGTGNYTIPLAKRVSHVYALDSAKAMLDRLVVNAQKEAAKNIIPIHKSWYRCSYKKEFDFVFASFCPAIRDTKSLMKMHRASRRYLCYVTACKEVDTFKQIRKDIWERITGKPFGVYRSFDVIYPFNFLYAKGLRPSLKYLTHTYKYEDSIQNQAYQLESFFESDVHL